MMHKFKFLLLTFIGFCIFSCKKETATVDPAIQLQTDIKIIKDYLLAKNLTAQSTSSGLHYIITEPGSNAHPTQSSRVVVRYKGYRTDGSVFDQTTGSSNANFVLGNLILGWREGIPLLGIGGKGTFFLPSALGYGQNGSSGIAGNTVLIFEIELIDFN